MWLLVLAIVYLLLLAAMYFAQDRMMFLATPRTLPPQQYGLAGFEEITLSTEDNVRLVAWFHQGAPGGKALVYFYGNADSLPGYAEFFRRFADAGYSVLGVNYRGYGGSEGKPNEQGFYADGRAAIEFLAPKVGAHNIIVAGRSIGSGVASKLASEFELGGLVLISPFTSVVDVAAKIYWYVPVRLLMRNKFDTAQRIAGRKNPVLLIHGDKDTLVPISHAQQLLELISGRKSLSIHSGAGHIDLAPERMADEIIAFFAHAAPQE